MKVWEHVFALVSELNEKSSVLSFKPFLGIFLPWRVSSLSSFTQQPLLLSVWKNGLKKKNQKKTPNQQKSANLAELSIAFSEEPFIILRKFWFFTNNKEKDW